MAFAKGDDIVGERDKGRSLYLITAGIAEGYTTTAKPSAPQSSPPNHSPNAPFARLLRRASFTLPHPTPTPQP